jgi:hypothetical protein
MKVFLKETSFHRVMIDRMFTASIEMKKELHDIMNEGIFSGVVHPLKRVVFADTELEQAFRYSCHDRELLRTLLPSMSSSLSPLQVPLANADI